MYKIKVERMNVLYKLYISDMVYKKYIDAFSYYE